jgi:hypothetical protein
MPQDASALGYNLLREGGMRTPKRTGIRDGATYAKDGRRNLFIEVTQLQGRRWQFSQGGSFQPIYSRGSDVAGKLVYCLLDAGFWLGLFFDHEDGSDVFLRNVRCLSMVYTALYPRRYNSS